MASASEASSPRIRRLRTQKNTLFGAPQQQRQGIMSATGVARSDEQDVHARHSARVRAELLLRALASIFAPKNRRTSRGPLPKMPARGNAYPHLAVDNVGRSLRLQRPDVASEDGDFAAHRWGDVEKVELGLPQVAA